MADQGHRATDSARQDNARGTGSAWTPFRHPAFTILWTATVVASIGTWMYNAACAWLMTSLSPNPLLVALVQVANALPMVLFAIPAGALTDIVDRRRLLVVAETATTALSAVFAVLVALGLVTPSVLLLFMFLIGAGSALDAPAWQAIVPELVPKQDLAPAIAANGVGVNVSRAIGPAVGGALTATGGVVVPLWINAISNLATVGALLWWHPPRKARSQIPAERFWRAIRTGWRYGSNSRPLRATAVRTAAFLVFASAYWALLPLVARHQIGGGPGAYGVLLGCIGLGAIVGAAALSPLRAKLGPDRVMAAATAGTVLALVLFGLARDLTTALVASLVAGVSWVAALATLNVSAQLALPDWVRGRGLALYVTVVFASMSLGSALWGQVATTLGLPAAHFLAGLGALVAIPVTWRCKLQFGAEVDLTPALSWPMPVTTRQMGEDQGPVLVTVEYHIDPHDRDAFLEAVERSSQERRRDGAYEWAIFEDTAQEGRFLETFLLESWLDHLRQHERTTSADLAVQHEVDRFNRRGTPTVTHLVAAERRP
jgi:MFS family permease